MATVRREHKALVLEALLSLEDKSVYYDGQWVFAGGLCAKTFADRMAREILIDHGILIDYGLVSFYPGLKDAFIRHGPSPRRIYPKTSAYIVNVDAFNWLARSVGRGRFEPRYGGDG